MLDVVLQLEVSPPVPLDTFFEPSFLDRLANPPKKEPPRFPMAAAKKKKESPAEEHASNMDGKNATEREAALADLRGHAQPEHSAPEVVTSPAAEPKQHKFRRSHHKVAARPVYAAPSLRSRKITVEPKPEPASLKPRKAKALENIELAMKRLEEMYAAMHTEIIAAKLQITAGTCNTLPAAEARALELFRQIRKVHAFAAQKHR